METEITRLNLVSALCYTPIEAPDPFGGRERPEYGSGSETLFCFELDEHERLSFEPERKKLLGKLVFGGKTGGELPAKVRGYAETVCELPKGNYLFAQKREVLNEEEITALAVEIQQEGLWQRLEPGNRLYLRRLFEDGRRVTQLFRPYTQPEPE